MYSVGLIQSATRIKPFTERRCDIVPVTGSQSDEKCAQCSNIPRQFQWQSLNSFLFRGGALINASHMSLALCGCRFRVFFIWFLYDLSSSKVAELVQVLREGVKGCCSSSPFPFTRSRGNGLRGFHFLGTTWLELAITLIGRVNIVFRTEKSWTSHPKDNCWTLIFTCTELCILSNSVF